MNELPGAHAAMAATPGAALAAARRAEGLSVVDVATQMRISPRQVEAIEADRYHELPGDVFVRGFIRNYARLLKLDPVPLLHALEPELKREVPLRAHEIAGTLPTARRSRKRLWATIIVLVSLGIVAILAATAAYEWWQLRSAAPFADSPVPAPGSMALPPPGSEAAPAAQSIPLAPQTLPDVPRPADPAAVAPTESQSGGEGKPAADAVAPAQQQAVPLAAADAARIEIQFERESWVEIRERDGKLVFMGTGEAGSARSFEARTPVALVIGNAAGVRIAYNGKPFDLAPHSARNIARFTLE
jgi:cytoskeleton protein RodZ